MASFLAMAKAAPETSDSSKRLVWRIYESLEYWRLWHICTCWISQRWIRVPGPDLARNAHFLYTIFLREVKPEAILDDSDGGSGKDGSDNNGWGHGGSGGSGGDGSWGDNEEEGWSKSWNDGFLSFYAAVGMLG